jgi:NADH dehydrogenase [ubiquinone] 1 alpha subcomplex assembly factor 7
VVTAVDEAVAELIRRRGPVPYDEVVDLALYDPVAGFFGGGSGAGRREDFLTSPEVGPLFGAVIARALDTWWDELGRPDPFTVVEAAAGAGTLARAVLAADPACLGALTYVLVERSEALRDRQREWLPVGDPTHAYPPADADDGEGRSTEEGLGPRVVSLGELPRLPVTGVVLANELLDNLAFRLLERGAGGWLEVRVALTGDGLPLVELTVPAEEADVRLVERLAPDAPEGARVPVQRAAADWLGGALDLVERGRVVVIDYGATSAELAGRAASQWIRTYRTHRRGGPVLDELGRQDITCEVALDQLASVRPPDAQRTQAAFLAAHGLGELVDEGRRIWRERAHIGDLEAIRARSRVGEGEALSDPGGLGAFHVLEWTLP